MMAYDNFLNQVIDEGIAAASESYKDDLERLKGAKAGFEMCRKKTPKQLFNHLMNARTALNEAFQANDFDDYWEIRTYELEIEWVCNVVSAALVNEGLQPIIPVTARAVMKAASILGVNKLQLH